MAKQKYKASDLEGAHIFHAKNQTVYYDSFTKNGYVLTNSDVEKYSVLQSRLTFGLLAAMILIIFTKNYILSILVGAVVYLVFTLIFRFAYLPTLYTIPNYKIPYENGFFVSFAKNSSFPFLYFYFGLALLLTLASVIVILSGQIVENDLYSTIIVLAISLLGLVMSIITIRKKKQMNKQELLNK